MTINPFATTVTLTWCISNYRNSSLLVAILIIQVAPESCETGLSDAITCITVITECHFTPCGSKRVKIPIQPALQLAQLVKSTTCDERTSVTTM